MPQQRRERDPLAVEFGFRIKLARIAGHLSRDALGRLLGVSARRIASIENGENMPSLATVIALRDALGAEWGTLLDNLPRST